MEMALNVFGQGVNLKRKVLPVHGVQHIKTNGKFLAEACMNTVTQKLTRVRIYNRLQCNQKTILEPLVDDLLGLRHLQEQKYKKRLALGEDIQHLAKQKHNLTRIHTLGYIEEPQFIERSAAIEQQIRERKQQLSRNDMSNTSEKILQKTRLIQKKLSSTPPLELFDESVFKELVKKVLISNTAIQFELINGMKLSESRAAT